MQHEFRDTDLPVKENLAKCQHFSRQSKLPPCGQGCVSAASRACHGIHRAQLDWFHNRVWNPRNFRGFSEAQWKLVPQQFFLSEFKYLHIESNRILPFFPGGAHEEGGAGNFAVVKPARMLRDYQDALDKVCSASKRAVLVNFLTSRFQSSPILRLSILLSR